MSSPAASPDRRPSALSSIPIWNGHIPSCANGFSAALVRRRSRSSRAGRAFSRAANADLRATGSGKTLAAFLICIDALLRKAIEGRLEAQTEVVYVSPLKALQRHPEKSAGALGEIQSLAVEDGIIFAEIRTAVRTGDTLASERRAMLKRPPHILVTTPESLSW